MNDIKVTFKDGSVQIFRNASINAAASGTTVIEKNDNSTTVTELVDIDLIEFLSVNEVKNLNEVM